jgi:cytochrome c oxidase cbb3-type subunit 4
MDPVNQFRSLVTVALFILFLAIVAWVYSSRNRGAFEEAAALPFEDDADQKISPAHGGTP